MSLMLERALLFHDGHWFPWITCDANEVSHSFLCASWDETLLHWYNMPHIHLENVISSLYELNFPRIMNYKRRREHFFYSVWKKRINISTKKFLSDVNVDRSMPLNKTFERFYYYYYKYHHSPCFFNNFNTPFISLHEMMQQPFWCHPSCIIPREVIWGT